MLEIPINPIGKIQIDKDNQIVYITYDKEFIEKEDTEKVIETVMQHTTDIEKIAIIADLRKVLYFSKDARETISKKYSYKVKSTALILKDKLQQSIVNIFMKFERPPYPTKAFTDKETAEKWTKNL